MFDNVLFIFEDMCVYMDVYIYICIHLFCYTLANIEIGIKLLEIVSDCHYELIHLSSNFGLCPVFRSFVYFVLGFV